MISSADPIRDRIVSLVRSAWAFAPEDRVVPGRPRLPITDYPYAVVALDRVPRSPSGARTVEETYSFSITGVWAWQDSALLEDLKVAKAQALGDALVSAVWSDIDAYDPRVGEVAFEEDADENPYFAVTLSFSVTVDVLQ